MEQKDSTMTQATPIMYGLDVQMYTKYEIYLDDIAIEKWYNNSLSSFVDLNPYLLKNGKHQISVRLLPHKGKDSIRPDDIRDSYIKLIRFERQNIPGQSRAKNYTELQKLEFPKIESSVPVLETLWEIEITELPYELDGWSRSQDLREMDSEELEKEVVVCYNMLRNLLNTGKVDEFFKFEEQKYKETTIYGYYSESEMKETRAEDIEILKTEAKGNMWPIEKYKMFVYGNGKLVRLERIDGENKGWDVLIRETPDGSITSTGTLLHKPQGSDTFQIIRK
ncbi:hypothetical protein [Sinomicrobium sp. M5D2P17]